MPSFRRRRKPSSGEDGAGWIYADLFLALMVVGLGSSVISTSTPGAAASEQDKTFQLSCVEFAVKVPANVKENDPRIDAGINAEIAKRGWTAENSKPGLVILMGGFSSSEGPGNGDYRAQRLLPSLRKSSALLSQVEMRTGGATAIRVNGTSSVVGGAGSFLMIVYLLFSGPPLSEVCTK